MLFVNLKTRIKHLVKIAFEVFWVNKLNKCFQRKMEIRKDENILLFYQLANTKIAFYCFTSLQIPKNIQLFYQFAK
jgi:hypothetical protein